MKLRVQEINLEWFKKAFSEPMYIGVADSTVMKFVGLGLVWVVGCHVDGKKNLYLLTKDGKIFYNERFNLPFGRFN